MQQIITDNLPQIIDVCKTHHVKALYVFGSAVRDDFNDDSDVDFVAEFLEPSKPDDLVQLRAYYDNMDELQEKLQEIVARKVDLIQLYAIKNKLLNSLINEEKQLVYAAA